MFTISQMHFVKASFFNIQNKSSRILADVYSMSLVHWELFRMVKEFNKDYHFTHELPFQKELGRY
jgi:hypothetical protein